MELYKIDDVAKMSGLTKRTIRYYEEIGLLPAPSRSEGGTRLYTGEHIETLNKLIRARDALGFSLQELQRYVEASDILEGKRQHYRQLTDTLTPEERKEKLLDMDETLVKQLELIESKLANIQAIKAEFEELRERIRRRLETL
ncbi:HTH-type transcriptional regulator YfmP [Cohnella xylanilytica]|uniref:MerR family transcriptional regulator n=1 Tax=Cohnella xylanilytica TaxID=557555 RepID=A0A841U9U9_9BACL|nr:MerR family transcriptional regulator [Cohnella xylanilytica]MBB6694710.1 MerR family transcriptional regulator [Cohnella xylanilytica]GIO13954.1 HTH-type transcriptional regulator YfmP [Cohnella xylanilytica]